MSVKFVRPIELPWICVRCDRRQRTAWPLVVALGGEETWRQLRDRLEVTCERCRAVKLPRLPAVLLMGTEERADRSFALLPDHHDPAEADRLLEALHDFLPAEAVDVLVPLRWPAEVDDRRVSANGPTTAVDDRVMRGLRRLLTGDDVDLVLTEHPEMRTGAAIEVTRDLHARLPPTGRSLAGCATRLVEDLAAARDRHTARAVCRRFTAEWKRLSAAVRAAGLRNRESLRGHSSPPDEEWDRIARETEQLLGMVGMEWERADLLLHVGTTVMQRPGRTIEDAEWALDWLDESRRRFHDLGDGAMAARAAQNLAAGLLRRARDSPEDLRLVDGLLADVMDRHQSLGDQGALAHTATNRGLALLRLADHVESEEAEELRQRSVDLFRTALPLRSRDRDPYGWAFTSLNLAMALTLLERRPDRLREAVTRYREAATIFAAENDDESALSALAHLGRALIGLAMLLDDEHKAEALGGAAAGYDVSMLRLMDSNPMAFGLHDPQPGIRRLLRSAPVGEAAALVAEAGRTADEGIERSRTLGHAALLGEFARISASVARALDRGADSVVTRLESARALIDHRLAPADALSVANEIAAAHSESGRWTEASRAFDDCMAIQDQVFADTEDRDSRLKILRQAPALARQAAYAKVRCGDHVGAVELLERTRLRTFEAVVGEAGPTGLGLLRWDSPTIDDVGRTATPDCPVAYVITVPTGAAILLVRHAAAGDITVDAFESVLSSAEFFAHLHRTDDPQLGLMSAQSSDSEVSRAVERIAEPLGRLLQPVADTLRADGVDRLLIIPCGPMSVVPWAAATLRHPDTGAPVRAGELLTLSIAPSCASAALSRRRAADRRGMGRVLVFADPDRPDLTILPGTRREAETIRRTLGTRVTVRAGAHATRTEWVRLAPGSWIVHMACHGYNDADRFEAMRLFLADGDLTLQHVRSAPPLRARLVVLSACQSGHSDLIRLSDDMIGLPVAFLAGGAAAVVGSLWPVSDRVTALLMERFYTELAAAPDDVARALRLAQLWVMSRHGDPCFWAGFFVLGA